MNNSWVNARSPWKCKQSASRAARWTRQSPEKNERIFASIIIFYYYQQIYSLAILMRLGHRRLLMQSARFYANLTPSSRRWFAFISEQEGRSAESKLAAPSWQCSRLYLSWRQRSSMSGGGGGGGGFSTTSAPWNSLSPAGRGGSHRNLTGLQLTIIFIIHVIFYNYLINCLFHEMSEKWQKCSSQFARAFRPLLLSEQQPNTQKLLIYFHEWHRKAANPHI